jgi:hypothetical protein
VALLGGRPAEVTVAGGRRVMLDSVRVIGDSLVGLAGQPSARRRVAIALDSVWAAGGAGEVALIQDTPAERRATSARDPRVSGREHG